MSTSKKEETVKVAFGKTFRVGGEKEEEDPFPWEQKAKAAAAAAAAAAGVDAAAAAELLDEAEEARLMAEPYRLQHDTQLYTDANLAARRALAKDPLIRQQINRLWMLLHKNERGCLGRSGYINLMIRLCKILNPDFRYAEALAVVTEDFKRDARHGDSLTYDQFFQSMFELADIWCPDISASSYAHFLDKAFRRMTVKIKRLPDGSSLALKPVDRVAPETQIKPTQQTTAAAAAVAAAATVTTAPTAAASTAGDTPLSQPRLSVTSQTAAAASPASAVSTPAAAAPTAAGATPATVTATAAATATATAPAKRMLAPALDDIRVPNAGATTRDDLLRARLGKTEDSFSEDDEVTGGAPKPKSAAPPSSYYVLATLEDTLPFAEAEGDETAGDGDALNEAEEDESEDADGEADTESTTKRSAAAPAAGKKKTTTRPTRGAARRVVAKPAAAKAGVRSTAAATGVKPKPPAGTKPAVGGAKKPAAGRIAVRPPQITDTKPQTRVLTDSKSGGRLASTGGDAASMQRSSSGARLQQPVTSTHGSSRSSGASSPVPPPSPPPPQSLKHKRKDAQFGTANEVPASVIVQPAPPPPPVLPSPASIGGIGGAHAHPLAPPVNAKIITNRASEDEKVAEFQRPAAVAPQRQKPVIVPVVSSAPVTSFYADESDSSEEEPDVEIQTHVLPYPDPTPLPFQPRDEQAAAAAAIAAGEEPTAIGSDSVSAAAGSASARSVRDSARDSKTNIATPRPASASAVPAPTARVAFKDTPLAADPSDLQRTSGVNVSHILQSIQRTIDLNPNARSASHMSTSTGTNASAATAIGAASTSAPVAGSAAAVARLLSARKTAEDLLYTESHPPYQCVTRSKPVSIWIIGKPLSGKRTLAEALARQLGLIHITADSAIAYARSKADKDAFLLLSKLDEGEPLTSQDLGALIRARLCADDVAFHGYVMSGSGARGAGVEHITEWTNTVLGGGAAAVTGSSAVALNAVWPPEYVVDLTLSDSDVSLRAFGPQRSASLIAAQIAGGSAMGSTATGASAIAAAANATANGAANGAAAPASGAASTATTPKAARDAATKKAAASSGKDTKTPERARGGGAPTSGQTPERNRYGDNESDTDGPGSSSARTSDAGGSVDGHTGGAFGASGSAPYAAPVLLSAVELAASITDYHIERTQIDSLLRRFPSVHSANGSRHNSRRALLRLDASQPPASLLRQVLFSVGQSAHSLPKPVAIDCPSDVVDDKSFIKEILVDMDGLAGDDLTIHEMYSAWQHYCPVCLSGMLPPPTGAGRSVGRLVEGWESFAASYLGQAFLFCTQQHLDKFLANPKYVSLPPELPSKYTIALVGGPRAGKTALATRLKDEFGWTVITGSALTADSKSDADSSYDDQCVLDGGLTTAADLEAILKRGIKLDAVVYLRIEVDDVELLPRRGLVLKSKLNLDSTPATAAVLKKSDDAKKSDAGTAAGGGGGEHASKKSVVFAEQLDDYEFTDEDEKLMTQSEEWERKYWKELQAAIDAVGNAKGDAATAHHTEIKHFAVNAAGSLDEVFDLLRRAIDPFYTHRIHNAVHRITAEDVKASKKDGQIDLGAGARQLQYGESAFCPVHRIDQKLLVVGKTELGVRVRSVSYSCCSEACVKLFMDAPQRYHVHDLNFSSPNSLRAELVLGEILPPKVIVTGPVASSKSIVAAQIAKSYGGLRLVSVRAQLHPRLRTFCEALYRSEVAADAKAREEKEARKTRRREERKKPAAPAADGTTGAGGGGDESGGDDEDANKEDEEDEKDEKEREKIHESKLAVLKAYLDSAQSIVDTKDEWSRPDHTAALEAVLSNTEWISSAKLEDILGDIVAGTLTSGSSDAKSNDEHNRLNATSGYVVEVDLNHAAVYNALANVILSRPTIVPHCIVPVDVSEDDGIERADAVQEVMRNRIRDRKRVAKAALKLQQKLLQTKIDAAAAAASVTAPPVSGSSPVPPSSGDAKDGDSANGSSGAGRGSPPRDDPKLTRGSSKLDSKHSKGDAKGDSKGNDAKPKKLTKAEREKEKADAAAAAAAAADPKKSAASARRKSISQKASNRRQSLAARKSVDMGLLSGGIPGLNGDGDNDDDLDAVGDDWTDPVEAFKQSKKLSSDFLKRLRDAGLVVLPKDLDTTTSKRNVERASAICLHAFMERQKALFHRAQVLLRADARKLLRCGTKSLRTFGTHCPVCMDGGVSTDCYQDKNSHPILWSHFVVYTCSDAHRDAFLMNVIRYISASAADTSAIAQRQRLMPAGPHTAALARLDASNGGAPAPPIASSVVLIGPPLSCKTLVARRLSEEFECVYLNMSIVLDRVRTSSSSSSRHAPANSIGSTTGQSSAGTSLARALIDALESGAPLSDELMIACLDRVIHDEPCRTRGWVLDNFPQTETQARLMSAAHIVPHAVFSLELGETVDAAYELISQRIAHQKAALVATAQSQAALAQQHLALAQSAAAQAAGASSALPVAAAPAPGQDAADATAELLSTDPTNNFAGAVFAAGVLAPAPSLAVLAPNAAAAATVAAAGANVSSYASDDFDGGENGMNYSSAADAWGDLQYYTSQVIGLHTYYQRNFDNLHVFNAATTKWSLTSTVFDTFRRHRTARQQYTLLVGSGDAASGGVAPVHTLGVTPRTVIRNRSAVYRQYCPVCWIQKRALNVYSSDLAFTLEYRHAFYHCCSMSHVIEFRSSPQSYVARDAAGAALLPALPADLPFRLSYTDCQRIQPNHCQLLGHCPVSILESIPAGRYRVIAGNLMCAVSYRNRIYRLAGESELAQFMQFPDRYADVTLPKKLPPKPPARSHPTQMRANGFHAAFLERHTSELLIRALAALSSGGVDPDPATASAPQSASVRRGLKYPGLSVTETATLFVAIYLKAHNPRNEPHLTEKYLQKLNLFRQTCTLITDLAAFYKSNSVPAFVDGRAAASSAAAPPPADAITQYFELSNQYDHHSSIATALQQPNVPKARLAEHFSTFIR